jgi:polyribonucleotide nucleotidyltransferase
MQPATKQYATEIGGKSVVIETGKLAQQAGGSVTVRLGDTIVFAAATMGKQPREGQDFFPLTIEYEERMYAGGRIPGSFFRREGRPSEDAILIARLTDRPLRPLFPQDMRNEVQVVMFSLSADVENPLDILAINAASAALMISDIPWGGPVGAVRVGRIDGKHLCRDGGFRSRPAYGGYQGRHFDGGIGSERNFGRCHGGSLALRTPIHAAYHCPPGKNGCRDR